MVEGRRKRERDLFLRAVVTLFDLMIERSRCSCELKMQEAF